MKVKNLLLAGLAAVAMTACSNEDEFANKNNQNLTGEQAKMRLLFSFNEKDATRAVTDGGTNAGNELEYGASKITAVLDYGDGTPRVVMKDLTLVKNDNSDIAVATTEPFVVTAGSNVTLYAFINPTGLTIDQKTDLKALAVGEHKVFTGVTLAYIDNDVAKNGDFLMSGTSIINKIEAGETVTTKIDVSRVAAKLEEKTDNGNLFPILASGLTFTDGTKAIGVKILNHSYSNLTTDSYVLPQANTFETFLQDYIGKGEAADDNSYRWAVKGATYCLENSSETNPTRVHYKAQVYFDETEANETFYIRAVYTGESDERELRVYKNWEALKAAYTSTEWDDSKKDDDEYLSNNDIKRYNGGICYYEAPINTANAGTVIARNNWYELTVMEVSKLGTPTPSLEPDETPAKLIISAQIQPWKVQINNIIL